MAYGRNYRNYGRDFRSYGYAPRNNFLDGLFRFGRSFRYGRSSRYGRRYYGRSRRRYY